MANAYLAWMILARTRHELPDDRCGEELWFIAAPSTVFVFLDGKITVGSAGVQSQYRTLQPSYANRRKSLMWSAWAVRGLSSLSVDHGWRYTVIVSCLNDSASQYELPLSELFASLIFALSLHVRDNCRINVSTLCMDWAEITRNRSFVTKTRPRSREPDIRWTHPAARVSRPPQTQLSVFIFTVRKI